MPGHRSAAKPVSRRRAWREAERLALLRRFDPDDAEPEDRFDIIDEFARQWLGDRFPEARI